MTSRARRIAESIAKVIDNDVVTAHDRKIDGAAIATKSLWHPSFVTKREIETPVVTVRPASRGTNSRTTKATSDSDVSIEIGLVQKLPGDQKNQTDHKDPAIVSELDELAENIFNLFLAADDDADDNKPTDGILSDRFLADEAGTLQYLPRTPSQPTTVDSELLETDRVFLTLITINYRKME